MTDTPTALVIDWGGVLTTPLSAALDPWLRGENLDPTEFRALMREWLDSDAGPNAAHDLEAGRISGDEFGRALADRIRRRDGSALEPVGLIDRMFAGFEGVPVMSAAVLRLRAGGVRTALLSNSWGNTYPQDELDELFDVVVISGEVGMRKPDRDIYELAVERLGVAPNRCVFVDDLRPNVAAAVALGMIGVHHTDAEDTIAELEAVFSVYLH